MENQLGVPRGGVKLQEYNPKWKDHFEEERARLLERFPGVFLEISHGGSTAVPGMKAKPIIDTFAAIHNLNDYTKIKDALESMGYEYRGE